MEKREWICCILLVIALGCSNNVPLRGTVLFSDNGEPVPRGLIMFESSNFMARGEIQSDGTFVVGSLRARDGMPPGDYRISIVGAIESYEVAPTGRTTTPPGVAQAAPMNVIPLIDPRYERASTSGLTVTVDRSTREHSVIVDRAQR